MEREGGRGETGVHSGHAVMCSPCSPAVILSVYRTLSYSLAMGENRTSGVNCELGIIPFYGSSLVS